MGRVMSQGVLLTMLTQENDLIWLTNRQHDSDRIESEKNGITLRATCEIRRQMRQKSALIDGGHMMLLDSATLRWDRLYGQDELKNILILWIDKRKDVSFFHESTTMKRNGAAVPLQPDPLRQHLTNLLLAEKPLIEANYVNKLLTK